MVLANHAYFYRCITFWWKHLIVLSWGLTKVDQIFFFLHRLDRITTCFAGCKSKAFPSSIQCYAWEWQMPLFFLPHISLGRLYLFWSSLDLLLRFWCHPLQAFSKYVVSFNSIKSVYIIYVQKKDSRLFVFKKKVPSYK